MEKRFAKNNFHFKLIRAPFQLLHYLAVHIVVFSFVAYGTVYFKEEFSDGDKWRERWISSEQPGQDRGFFILTAGKFNGHPEKSKGIQTFQDGAKYGLSTKFPPFSNKGKTLVIQYTVKHEQSLKCGGGYVKLFNCSLQPRSLHKNTPYLLMFGPDKCVPTTLKIHVIFNYKGNYLKFKKQIHYKEDYFTHLYTLIINHDNTYVVTIDNKDVASGKLIDDWDFLPPEEFFDYDAKQSSVWDDILFNDDPTDVESEGWDDPFVRELIQNPNYEGEPESGRSSNPNYQDQRITLKIENPEFTEDPELYKFEEICAVGFDIYQAESGTIFDNILITDDVDYAEQHSWKTWGSLRNREKKMARELLQQDEERQREL